MFTAIAILAIAAAIITALAFSVMSVAMYSMDFSWENLLFYLHPNISFDLAVVTAISYALPVLPLIGVWLLFAKTHLMKCGACLVWIVSLFLVEEIMMPPNVELLSSGVFVAVITLAVFHMLAFFRIHILIYSVFKIIGSTLQYTCVFMSPLVMRILIEEVVKPFIHIACQYNIHSFGLFVVGASFSCYIMKEIVLVAAAGANVIVTSCCCIIRSIFFGLIAIGTFFKTSVEKTLRYLHRQGQLPSQVLWPQQRAADETHPSVLPCGPSVTWSDGLASDHLPFQPHTDGDSVSRSWFLLVDSRRNKQRLTKHVGNFRLALCEISSLVKRVSYVELDPTRREGFMESSSHVNDNYELEARAESALAELTLLYDELKQRHPGRFRSWSYFSKLYEECLLFHQSMDIIFLEMKLRAEFDAANDAIQCVRSTIEDVEEEDDKAADPILRDRTEDAPEAPAVELPLPQDDALLPVDNDDFQVEFDNDDGGGEEVVEEVAPIVRKHQHRSNACLHSDLGSYWSAPLHKRTGGKTRRSNRVRRKPQRFEP